MFGSKRPNMSANISRRCRFAIRLQFNQQRGLRNLPAWYGASL